MLCSDYRALLNNNTAKQAPGDLKESLDNVERHNVAAYPLPWSKAQRSDLAAYHRVPGSSSTTRCKAPDPGSKAIM